MYPPVADIADRDQLPAELVRDVLIGKMVNLRGVAPSPALADAIGAIEDTSAKRLPFGGAKMAVIFIPPFPAVALSALGNFLRAPDPLPPLILNCFFCAHLINIGGVAG